MTWRMLAVSFFALGSNAPARAGREEENRP